MPDGLTDLIKEVVMSWQVIAVTIAFILFSTIVSAAANPHQHQKAGKAPLIKKIKRPKEQKADLPKDVDTSEIGLGE